MLFSTVLLLKPFFANNLWGLSIILSLIMYAASTSHYTAWHQRFATHITSFGFVESKADASLFVYKHGTSIAYLLLYVQSISKGAVLGWMYVHIGLNRHWSKKIVSNENMDWHCVGDVA
ncbi:hypothetical protein Sjap_019073 [Stephania japonica]|uniref:Uncharacterized protein n=1 Tax=Stephania japonica TaxID=461633 RepID=A0AAP0HZD3_9MAGN